MKRLMLTLALVCIANPGSCRTMKGSKSGSKTQEYCGQGKKEAFASKREPWSLIGHWAHRNRIRPHSRSQRERWPQNDSKDIYDPCSARGRVSGACRDHLSPSHTRRPGPCGIWQQTHEYAVRTGRICRSRQWSRNETVPCSGACLSCCPLSLNPESRSPDSNYFPDA